MLKIASIDINVIRSKFRGALLGVLVGDCLGAPFEGDYVSRGDKLVIQQYFEKLELPNLKGPFRKYTDDTSMTKSVAESLIKTYPGIDYTDMARLFVRDYFQDPHRGYGHNVVQVFTKLRDNKCKNVFLPATEQFGGNGSYGNGGAMRVTPIALALNKNPSLMAEVATTSTQLTHSNVLGVNGALLQSYAVIQALNSCPDTNAIDEQVFCSQLISNIREFESDPDGNIGESNIDTRPYQHKIELIRTFLECEKDHNIDEFHKAIVTQLGNSVSAVESVPLAIFCFLRALKDIPTISTDNIFRRVIQYAISFGGDADTIASMAGAIAGAYLGQEAINVYMCQQCEKSEDMINLADKLYDLVYSHSH